MINPPQVLPEEPTAVTPHGGFCGGKSQQWLRYPTNPLVRICAGASGDGRPYREWKPVVPDLGAVHACAPRADVTTANRNLSKMTSGWPHPVAKTALTAISESR